MKLSGVDGVMIDWYGVQGTNGDIGSLLTNSNAIVGQVDDVGLKFGVVMEDRFSTVSSGNTTPDINKGQGQHGLPARTTISTIPATFARTRRRIRSSMSPMKRKKFSTNSGLAGKQLAQLRILRRDADRAGIEMAHAHHHAAQHDERRGREPNSSAPSSAPMTTSRPVFI